MSQQIKVSVIHKMKRPRNISGVKFILNYLVDLVSEDSILLKRQISNPY